MDGVEISYIDLDVDGALAVERLALALEDGTIIGDSWLATFLRGDVLRRGPLGLDDLERRYNNGYFGAALVKHQPGGHRQKDHGRRESFASGKAAGGRTAAEEKARVLDWLERHEVQQENGHYLFYHATPTNNLKDIQRGGGLRAGSLLETDPDSAAFFAARDRDLDESKVTVLRVLVKPHEIRVGQWAELRSPIDVEGKLSKARVYVPEEGDVPEGSVAQHGKRGGIYYETQPHFKAGDLVMIHGTKNDGQLGRISPDQEQGGLGREGYVDVEIQSPYGNYRLPFRAENLRRLAGGHKPPAGQVERQERRRGKILDKVIRQFANDVRTAKKLRPAGGGWNDDRFSITIGDQVLPFHRYDTNDGIGIFVPTGVTATEEASPREKAALSLKRLLNYVAKMPPSAVQDLRKHVKKIVLSPVPYPNDSTVWGSMNSSGDLTVYPGVKAEDADKVYSQGTFHGANPPLTDVAVARVLTHEVGHALFNHVETLLEPYNSKVTQFWEEYEKAGGQMPASDERMDKILAENGIPPHPTRDWWREYNDMLDIQTARYNTWTPKIPAYDIPGEYRTKLEPPKEEWAGGKMVGNGLYTWEELPPKVKLAFLDKVRQAQPVSGYAEKNKHEYYAEGYEHYQWGTLPSEHVLYRHFHNLARVEQWIDNGVINIKKVYHRHEPADWNNDEGLYHGHEHAGEGHEHGKA